MHTNNPNTNYPIRRLTWVTAHATEQLFRHTSYWQSYH